MSLSVLTFISKFQFQIRLKLIKNKHCDVIVVNWLMCGVERTSDVTSCIVCQMAQWVFTLSRIFRSLCRWVLGSLGR